VIEEPTEQKLPPIADFVKQYSNAQTRMAYASSIYSYLAFIYDFQKDKKVTPSKAEKYETLAERYISEDRNHSQDLKLYVATFEGKPAKTCKCYVSAVQEFFLHNDIEISPKEKKSLKNKMPKGGAATVERDLDLEVLRIILQHCDLKLRALILLLVSSGIRIGEALALRISDIDLTSDIGVITIRAENTKTGDQRYTFCSREACEAIREWIKKRPSYLIEAQNKGRGLNIVKKVDDDRLFPIADSTVNMAWENAIKAAGLHSRDPMTNRLQIHPHMCRKFFSSQLRIVVPEPMVEGLMGHNTYLSDAYRRYTKKQVMEFYQKGEIYLTIQMPEDVRELKATVDKRMQTHSEIIEGVVRENIQLKDQMTKVITEIEHEKFLRAQVEGDPLFAAIQQAAANAAEREFARLKKIK
jgi:integrase